MAEKEYVFIGTAQNKTRDYIKMLEEENREMKKAINKAIQKLNKYRNRKDSYCLWCMNFGDNAEIIKILGGEVINE